MRASLVAPSLGCLMAAISAIASAQTTAALGTSIVFPVAAQTVSFASEMTLFNPGASLLTATVSFYEANNSSAPGPKICNDVAVPAGRSLQLTLATQCALAAGGHFGLVVVSDKTVPASHAFYGYMRVQNPQGIGFSVEGFPVSNFSNQVSHATGLKKQAAAPGYQTNCFVGSLDQPVGYQLKLFNDSTGTQIGSTLAGTLTAFQQVRYLDVFGVNGANAPAGDRLNVRAEFTQTSGDGANLIGFCTVQDNASFGADFRIAKSYGSPSGSFYAQGGNAFGATARLGTNDNQPLELYANGQRTARYEPNATSPNLTGGHSNNSVGAFFGQTIAGGGIAGTTCFDPTTGLLNRSCGNTTSGNSATVSGGDTNAANSTSATVGGGSSNTADFTATTVGGGQYNTASGYAAVVSGGYGNSASGDRASVAGGNGNLANSAYSTSSGGLNNVATATASTIAGGDSNIASGTYSTVSGGETNVASGTRSSVAGGKNNTASGQYSFVAAGLHNFASDFSFASGALASARESGMFVWSDARGYLFDPVAFRTAGQSANTFNVRATGIGGVLFVTGIDSSTGAPTSVCYTQNLTGWSCTSDRNVKRNLRAVDTQSVLAKVVAMPVYHWQPKDGPNREIEHLGPMAQDFKAAFGLGDSDKAIGFQDADGVALAAIQGLHRLVEQKDAQIQALQQRVESMQQRMTSFESLQARVAAIESSQEVAAQRRAASGQPPAGPPLIPVSAEPRAAN
jgi:hypothetical protein